MGSQRHISYLSTARKEKDYLQETYGAQFSADFDRWLEAIASNKVATINVETVTESLSRSRERFGESDIPNKIAMVLKSLKRFHPPCEKHVASAWFRLLDHIPENITAYFVLEDGTGPMGSDRVIFTMFELGEREIKTE